MQPSHKQNNTGAARAASFLSRFGALFARIDLTPAERLIALAVAFLTPDEGVALVSTADIMRGTGYGVATVRAGVHKLAERGLWLLRNHGRGYAIEWQELHEGAAVVNKNATIARTPTFDTSSSPAQEWRIIIVRAWERARAFGSQYTIGAPVRLSDSDADALGLLCEALAERLGDRELVPGALCTGFIGWMRGVVARGAVPIIKWAAQERDSAEIFAFACKDAKKPKTTRDEVPLDRGPRRAPVENTFAGFAMAVNQ